MSGIYHFVSFYYAFMVNALDNSPSPRVVFNSDAREFSDFMASYLSSSEASNLTWKSSMSSILNLEDHPGSSHPI